MPFPQDFTMRNDCEDTHTTDDRWYCDRMHAFCITAIHLNAPTQLWHLFCVHLRPCSVQPEGRKRLSFIIKRDNSNLHSLQEKSSLVFYACRFVFYMSLKRITAAHTTAHVLCQLSLNSNRGKLLPKKSINLPHQEMAIRFVERQHNT